MSTINSTFLLNQSPIVKLLGGGSTNIALPNQTSGQYVLTLQPNAWQTDSINSGFNNDFKLSTIKDKYGLTVISNQQQEYSSAEQTNCHSLTANQKPLPSSSSSNNCSNSITNVTPSSSSSTMATFIQTSNGGQYLTPSLATSSHSDLINTISSGAINPHIYTTTTNQILGPTGALLQQQGGHYLIAQRGGNSMGLVGYPSTGAAVMIPQNQSNGDNNTLLTAAAGPQLISTLQPSISPMVQVLLANGQLLTTSLANLQAANTGFNPVQQQGSGQYTTNYTGNIVPTGVTSTPHQAQLVTNQSGQIFAITSPTTPTMVNSVTGQTYNTHQTLTGSSTIPPNHYIQIATPSGIALVPANQISQLSSSQQQLAQQLTTTSSCATNTSDNEAAKIQVQQIIQQQQQSQLNLQSNQAKISSNCGRRDEIISVEESKRLQQQTSLEESSNENNITLGSTKIGSDLTGQVSQAIQVSISSASSSPIIISPNVFQSAVSSTTSSSKTIDSKSPNNQTIPSDSQASPAYTSVESQTLSPTPPLSNASSMEPESTTHNTATVAHTINNTDASIVDGVNLEEIKEFARQFKLRRLSLGLTQTQVGQALSATEGPSYSQSAICRFEKLDITPKSAQKIKPVLEQWMQEAEERFKNGNHNLTDFIGNDNNKKRKRRTSFTPSALEILNAFFEKNTHPSSSEMTELADKLRYDREVVRVWFCNKRQALRNNVKKLEPSSSNVIIT